MNFITLNQKHSMYTLYALVILVFGVAAFLYLRRTTNNRTNARRGVPNASHNVQLAARRFRFDDDRSSHPADAIKDPRVAVATIGLCILELDGAPCAKSRSHLIETLQSTLQVTFTEAEEMIVLARWLIGECRGPDATIQRVVRNLYDQTSGQYFSALIQTVSTILDVNSDALSFRQKRALGSIKKGELLSDIA